MHVLDFILLFQSSTRRDLRVHRRHKVPQSDANVGGGMHFISKALLRPPKFVT